MKKALATLLTMAAVMGSSLTVFAAPETMPDGTVFDAEYYAQTYPDVVAALGTDRDALYNHYVTYGKAEGRSACASDVQQPVSVPAPSATKIGTTLTETLVVLEYYPDFMLTDSRPRKFERSTYEYDNDGNMTFWDMGDYSYRMDFSEGRINKIYNKTWTWIVDGPECNPIYDEQGRLIKFVGNILGGSTQLEYNEQGFLTKATKSSPGDVYEIAYNEQGKLSCVHLYNRKTEEEKHTYYYIYDEQGRLINKKETIFSSSYGNRENTYTYNYDASGRLISRTQGGWTRQYIYE